METLKFRSNIKCTGCLEKVTPNLNSTEGIDKWEIDLVSPEKILTVQGNVTAEEIERAVREAGYSTEKIN